MNTWVKVKDESELRAGMCVELRPCRHCGKKERMILIEARTSIRISVGMDGQVRPHASKYAFRHTGHRRHMPWVIFGDTAIPEGRLYRLIDDAPTSESTTETTRELERMR